MSGSENIRGEFAVVPAAVVRALDHVRSIFPEVTHVVYTRECKWLYMSDEGAMPTFNGLVDVGILEDACDTVASFPCVFCVQGEVY
ncbi:hypothetical protein ACK249_005707 [Pseudomonas aeruginosa]|uniref:hypothetical protein n=1 Tax=Pseudomonas aeruginosa TaxID=287 RepID=UPI00155F0A21|nr:hypothetical protein [Pseudomonas aeruginosa]EKW9639503.1 hypothetical protein [Pseudomonas aeruginosa]NRC34308.1 hypothetical protein [Pseudomonas aeruginosa]